MTPYIILVLVIFLFRGMTLLFPNSRKGDLWFLRLVFAYVFIFCGIRSFSVGIDIPGYINMYNFTAFVPWNDWDYVYFENGYIAMMKVSNMLGLTSRGFFWIVYAIILYPIYKLLRDYSVSPLFSVIIYLSLQFFVFDLTGLRQAMAMSICILAFMQALKKGWKHFVLFAALVLLASTIHKSSLIFMFAYFVMRLPHNRKVLWMFIGATIAGYLLNRIGISTLVTMFDKSNYEHTDNESAQLGLFLILILIFSIGGFITYAWQRNPKMKNMMRICTNLGLTAVALMLLFNGSGLLRSCMFYYIFMLILIPFEVSSLQKSLRPVATIALSTLLLFHFFVNEIHSFKVTPYEVAREQGVAK